MKKIKKFKLRNALNFLTSAFSVGFVSTGLVLWLAYTFYEARATPGFNWESHGVLKVLQLADLKSIDLRLQARGPRVGSERVALLAVDEKAVTTIGRWPWPREKIGYAIDKAVEYGASVLAFDMVFSEPSANPAKSLVDEYRKKQGDSSTLQSLAANLDQYDSDKRFSDTLQKNADKIVMGSFFLDPAKFINIEAGYISACRDLIFKQSSAYNIWQNEEALIPEHDELKGYLPEILAAQYSDALVEVSKQAQSEFELMNGPAVTTYDKYQLERMVIEHQSTYCQGWLDDEYDGMNDLFRANPQVWPAVLASDDVDFEHKDFDAWRKAFPVGFKTNLVLHTLNWVMNTPQISASAKHTGYFNAQLDPDGTIRRSQVLVSSGENYFPSIALKAYLVANKYAPRLLLGESKYSTGFKGIQGVEILDENGDFVKTIPVTERGHLRINFAGKDRMFPHASFAELFTDSEDMEVDYRYVPALANTIADCTDVKEYKNKDQVRTCKINKKKFFKDKIFIVGATAIGIFDLRVTPFFENYPGAETHANVIDNLVRDDFLTRNPDEPTYMYIGLIVLGLLVSLALNHMGAIYGMLLTLGTLVGVGLIDKYYLFENGTLVSIMFLLMMIAGNYVLITFYKYFTEERNKKELRSTFSKYVSPAIVNEILEDPENIELGGRKETITVFFSDIRGFTTISEKLDPRALSDLLNSYLTPMTDLVFENRGTLDKYMGDAIMAFFGAPIHYPDHAKYACRCALQQLEKLKELQKEYAEKGLPMIDVGIGLNTGECSVGNMGSESVRSYTVMGDAVNLGSRLEGINKQYGTRIIISEFTHADVKDDFVTREIDWVRVKGKILPVKIFELVAENQAPDQLAEVIELFKDGYSHYHERAFQPALESFSKALNINPADACSQLYLKRCQEYIDEPPPDDWDGVFVMTTK